MEKNRITGGSIVQPRAAQTREKILRTAIHVYAQKGYHAATVDEIAKAAGVSVGTAYRYFRDKKELLLEALSFAFEHFKELTGFPENDLPKARSIQGGSLEETKIKEKKTGEKVSEGKEYEGRSFETDLDQILIAFEKLHLDYFAFHEELEGLRHTDEDVRKLYENFTESALETLFKMLPEEVRKRPYSETDLRIALGIMENHCHDRMNVKLSEEELAHRRKRTVELVQVLLRIPTDVIVIPE